jgi:hypothetical protein
MAWRFGIVEEALIRDCHVLADDVGALKARIWNFRKQGLIETRKVGSGARESFSFADAVALRLALELSFLGIKPKRAISITKDALRYPVALQPRQPEMDKDVNLFIAFALFGTPEHFWPMMAEGSAHVARVAKEHNGASYIVVNLSKLVRQMTQALA